MTERNTYFHKVKPFVDTDLIKVLVGMRRVGKSVLLGQIADYLKELGVPEDHILYYNFEQIQNASFCTAPSLHQEITRRIKAIPSPSEGRRKFYLFFDEIQEVNQWEKCINSFRLDFDCDIYITGSNSRLLSGELATYLAGRYVRIQVFPFSLAEFIQSCNENPHLQDRSTAALFQRYLESGGMPFVSAIQTMPDSCLRYLQDIFNSVILKDIIQRNRIRDADLLERVIVYTLLNISHTFSSSSLAKYFKSESRRVSNETIMNYLSFCGQAFLFHKIPRMEISTKRLLTVNEKYYVADHSFATAIYGSKANSIDQILENLVCVEALRRDYEVKVGKVGDREIDFVLERGGERIYVQVCYLLASPETTEREFGVYRHVHDNFPKYVVSLDEFDMGRDGIRHHHLRDFLLLEQW